VHNNIIMTFNCYECIFVSVIDYTFYRYHKIILLLYRYYTKIILYVSKIYHALTILTKTIKLECIIYW